MDDYESKDYPYDWYDKSPKSGRPRERERERIVIYNCVLFGNIRIVIFMPN